jgi:WD40 repeat protein
MIERFKHLPQSTQPDTGPPLQISAGLITPSVGTVAAGSEEDDGLPFLSPPRQPGELGWLGPFRVLSVLGRGGMGLVLQAEDSRLQRPVAIKVMRPGLAAQPEARQRFLREARAAAAVSHEHVVTIHHVDELNQNPYLVMPLLQGESLAARLKRGRLAPVEVVRIGRETALGLTAAHAQGLIHRDIKPANLWLEGEPGALATGVETSATGGRVKILDFGLARQERRASDLTQEGLLLGTPGYLAPEQARGAAVDARCDLFSLGVVLYEMATGKLPFSGETVMTQLTSLLVEEPTPPLKRDPTIPGALSDLIVRLLCKDPRHRPASAQEVADALERIRQTLPAEKRSRPRRLAWVAAALVAVGVLIATVVIIRDRSGKEVARIEVTDGGKVEVVPGETKGPVIESEPFRWEKGAPLTPAALVLRSEPLPGLASRTLISRGTEGNGKGVAYSPDGQQFACADSMGTVRICESATGQLLRVFPGDGKMPEEIAWSPKGPYLAVSYEDGVRLWNPHTGRFLRRLRGHPGRVVAVAWSADGQTLASGDGGTICLWNPFNGQLLKTFTAPEGALEVRWSPDGRLLASAGPDRIIRLWNVAEGVCRKELRGHEEAIRSVCWSPSGKELASAGLDRTVRVWDATTGEVRQTLRAPAAVFFVNWSPDGQTLCTSGGDDALRFWKRASGEPLRTIPSPSGSVWFQTLSPDGKALLCSYRYGDVRIWDTTTGEQLQYLPSSPWFAEYLIQPIAWSPDGRRLASAAHDGTVTLWQADAGHRLLTLPALKGPVAGAAWSAVGKLLAVVRREATEVQIWDTSTGKMVRTLEGHTGALRAVAWSRDGKLLASAGADHTVRLWDGVAGKHLRTLEGHTGEVRTLAWAHDHKRLASAGADGSVRLWQAEDGKTLKILDGKTGPLSAVAWAAEDGTLACGGDDRAIRLWDVEAGKVVDTLTGHHDAIAALDWSPDGKRLASIGHRDGVRVWDGRDGTFLRSLADNPLLGLAVSWSPDGKTLAAGSWNGRISFWDPHGQRRAVLLTSPQGPDLVIGAEGHFRSSPAAERFLVTATLTEAGEYQSLSLKEFAERYGWKNDPSKVQPLGKPAGPVPEAPRPDPYELKAGDPLGPLALVSQPAPLKGVRTWTIEPRAGRAGIGFWAAGFSPDGQWLATGHLDGTVSIREASTGQVERLLCGHTDRVDTLAWSPDSKTLASGCNDGTIRLWEAQTGRLHRMLRGHAGPVIALAWAPDSKVLGSSGDGAVILWDAASGQRVQDLQRDPRLPVRALAWSPGGKRIAGARDNNGVVQLWDAESGQGIRALHGHKGAASGVAWSPDGKTLVSTGADKIMRFWDPDSGKQVRSVEGIPGYLPVPAWSPNGRRIAVVGHGGTQLWDASSAALLRAHPDGTSSCWGVTWTPDSGIYGSINNLGLLRWWNISDGVERQPLGPDASRRVIVSPDGKAQVWLTAGNLPHIERDTLQLPGWNLMSSCGENQVAWSADSRRLASRFGPQPRILDAESGKVLSVLDGHAPPASPGPIWSPTGNRLATVDGEGIVRIWDGDKGKLQQTLTEKLLPGTPLAWSPDGTRLAGIEKSTALRIWDARDGKSVAWVPLFDLKDARRCQALACAHDGRTWLVGVLGEGGRLISLEAEKAVRTIPFPSDYRTLAWSSDDRQVFIGTWGSNVEAWDVATGHRVHRWRGHTGWLTAVGSADEGRLVFSADNFLMVRYWEAATGRPRVTFQGLPGNRHVLISPEGHYRGSPGIERQLVYVVVTDKGEQENLTPAQFALEYGWKNDPDRVRVDRKP